MLSRRAGLSAIAGLSCFVWILMCHQSLVVPMTEQQSNSAVPLTDVQICRWCFYNTNISDLELITEDMYLQVKYAMSMETGPPVRQSPLLERKNKKSAISRLFKPWTWSLYRKKPSEKIQKQANSMLCCA